MKVENIGKRSFQLTQNGQILGRLSFDNIFWSKAHITLNNGYQYKLKSNGFNKYRLIQVHNDTELAMYKVSLLKTTVTFHDGFIWTFKPKGIFSSIYYLSNEDKSVEVTSESKWFKMFHRFHINLKNSPQDPLLILLAVFSVIKYKTMNIYSF